MGKLHDSDFDLGPVEPGIPIPKKEVVRFDLEALSVGDSRRILARHAGISMEALKNAANRETRKFLDRKFTYRAEHIRGRPAVRIWRRA